MVPAHILAKCRIHSEKEPINGIPGKKTQLEVAAISGIKIDSVAEIRKFFSSEFRFSFDRLDNPFQKTCRIHFQSPS
jgi:hypothetical protein